jgi:hypothetical protein
MDTVNQVANLNEVVSKKLAIFFAFEWSVDGMNESGCLDRHATACSSVVPIEDFISSASDNWIFVHFKEIQVDNRRGTNVRHAKSGRLEWVDSGAVQMFGRIRVLHHERKAHMVFLMTIEKGALNPQILDVAVLPQKRKQFGSELCEDLRKV